jgi:hypothetical protein
MTLQICTFKWGNKYTLDHVARLHNMLARNLTLPWRFNLITDDPGDRVFEDLAPNVFPGVRVLPLWEEMRDAKLCGVRLRAFGSDMREMIGERFAWIDLDVVITGNVDHIFSRPEPFIALSTPQGPLAYNGSLVMMDAGARPLVWAGWTRLAYASLPAHYRRLGMEAGGESDEGWMTRVLGPYEPRFNGGWGRRDDGIYFFRKDLESGRKPLPANACMVIMNGRAFDPSSEKLQARAPWIAKHWR